MTQTTGLRLDVGLDADGRNSDHFLPNLFSTLPGTVNGVTVTLDLRTEISQSVQFSTDAIVPSTTFANMSCWATMAAT